MPNVIDLFAGAGGLSLGAARAGFEVKLAVEKDPHAMATHKLNFPNCAHSIKDVGGLSGANILTEAKILSDELSGIIGGPPCQGFSIIGRQEKTDERNDLFSHFFRIVKELSPDFFVAENVPGILQPKYDDLREKALAQVKEDYEIITPFPVKASDYGAPTIRKRIFFIGYKPEKFSKTLAVTDFHHPVDTVPTYVEDALFGLPETISSDWLEEPDGWRPTIKSTDSEFLRKVVGDIPEGIGDPLSLERYLECGLVSGCLGTRHKEEVEFRYGSLEHGKKDSISKSVRLDPKGFCPTLRAGTGSDKGSYQAVRPIHYKEARVITPREAARLQGFPDWFVFHPTKWHSFRQIGNSVSPIVSEYLLKVILNNLHNEPTIGS